MKRLTTEEYIKRAIEKYNDLYDYSEIEYINAKTKIKIRCRRCGKIFWQLPFAHLNGQGCSSCNGGVKKDKNYFIIKATKKHGNLYDYSEGDYINSRTPYKIKCKKCDKYFFQTPDNHMRGQGCPWCAGKNKNTKTFIEQANLIHNHFYIYDKTIYINSKTKVIITCPIHGDFKQLPTLHLSHKQGCPYCKESHGEKEVAQYLKEHNIKFEREKRFDNCKNKRKLPFDFYLPELNTCIEYDGIQHFKKNSLFHKNRSFKTRIKNDQIKNQYCKENNIKLIRIKYNESIKNILNNFFNFKEVLDKIN